MRELDWLAASAPEDVTVLSGAGVSVEGPSALPTGWELTRRVFDAYFPPGTLEHVLDAHRAIGWIASSPCPTDPPGVDPRLPRLETVLGVVARVHGQHVVDEAVADVAVARPNRLHRFLARHLVCGGGHLTANFDECVEKAAVDLGHVAEVTHFHGATGPAGGDLGATLERIERGFPADLKSRFVQALRSRKCLLVLGYSGSDFFDVDVAVWDLAAGELAGVRVAWMLHSDHTPHLVTNDSALPPLVSGLRGAGARVDVVCCPTASALGFLAGEWGFPVLGAATPRTPSPPTLVVDDTLRDVAALELFLETGMFDRVRAILSSPPPRASRRLLRAAVSATLWELGRWNDLRRFWWRVQATTGEQRAQRLERIGATFWVQGRFLPAYLWLTWHRRKATGAAVQVFAETEGRVLEHMLRTPDLAWFARRAMPPLLAVLQDPGQGAGVHSFRRLSDLRTSLAATDRAEHATTSTEWFGQAGNLLAWVTYRHRALRDSYDPSITDAELRVQYATLRSQYAVLGSVSGAMRTILLPGSERVFTTGDVVQSLLRLQHGWWHRTRIIVRYWIAAAILRR